LQLAASSSARHNNRPLLRALATGNGYVAVTSPSKPVQLIDQLLAPGYMLAERLLQVSQ
jgi:hypothetical protein